MLHRLVILLAVAFVVFGPGCSDADSNNDASNAEVRPCASDDDCPAGHSCGNGTCRPASICEITRCGVGVCEPVTGECVNADPCDPALGDAQCLRGFSCFEGTCIEDSMICVALDCRRGICDQGKRRCVAPITCTDDVQCLEGQTCYENECFTDFCEDRRPCPRGACSPEHYGGRCINVDPCEIATDCLEGWDCHQGRCVEEPCDGFCPGLQVCISPAVGEGPSCAEPSRCLTAADCVGDRYCSTNRCTDPAECVDDLSEPNDDPSTADEIVLDASSGEASVEASLCPGDVDYFRLDATGQPADATLTVDLSVVDGFQGKGTFRLDVLDENGTTLGTSSGEEPTQLRLERADVETFYLRVEADVTRPALFEIVAAFDAPGELLGCDTRLSSGANLRSTPQLVSAVTSNCGQHKEGAAGYWFELDRTQVVHVAVFATTGTPAVAISETCGVGAAVLDCDDHRHPSDGGVHVRELLPPGTYYISVEADPDATGAHEHVIRFETSDPSCIPGQIECRDGTIARLCGEDGYFQSSVECDGGCDEASNTCWDRDGDSCVNPLRIGDGFSTNIDWGGYEDDFQISSGHCGDSSLPTGSGDDAVFEVALEAGERLTASLDLGDRYGSLYVVEDCLDTTSCRAGDAGVGALSVKFENRSRARKSVFVVADWHGQPSNASAPNFSLEIDPKLCQTSGTSCVGDSWESCRDGGYALERRICPFGCDPSGCLPGSHDTCSEAVDLIHVGTHIQSTSSGTNSYDSAPACGGLDTGGADVTYDVTGAVGDVVTVSLDAGPGATLSIVTDCADIASTCVAAIANEDFASVEFVVEPNKQYFAIVDSPLGQSVNYEISAESRPPDCLISQRTCVDAATLQYCSNAGAITRYRCDGECRDGFCSVPRATSCVDAQPVSTFYLARGLSLDTASRLTMAAGPNSACTFDQATAGAERIYRLDVDAGDSVTARASGGPDLALYLLDTCGDAATCLAGASVPDATGNYALSYTATTTTTLYLVADSDGPGPTSTQLDIDVSVDRPCTVDERSCDVTGREILYCTAAAVFSSRDCSSGACAGSACTMPDGESCREPIVIGEGRHQAFLRGTDNFNGNTVSAACQARGGQSDDFYAIDMVAGQRLDLQGSTLASYYLLRNCFDAGTCRTSSDSRGALTFFAPTTGRYYLVVDAIADFNAYATFEVSLTP